MISMYTLGLKWSMHQEGRTGLRWPYGVRRSCLCTDPERVRCCRGQYQESRPCYTCVDGDEQMLDPRSVCVSSGDRSGGVVFQPGIQRSCRSTAETSIVSVGLIWWSCVEPGIRKSCQRTATTRVMRSEVLLRHSISLMG